MRWLLSQDPHRETLDRQLSRLKAHTTETATETTETQQTIGAQAKPFEDN